MAPMNIPEGHYVLHGQGAASSFIQNLKKADLMQVVPEIDLPMLVKYAAYD